MKESSLWKESLGISPGLNFGLVLNTFSMESTFTVFNRKLVQWR